MKEYKTIGERIQHIIDTLYYGVRVRFAEEIGYSPQVIGNIVTGRKTKPSFKVLNAIIDKNEDVNTLWLLTGEGKMLKTAKPQPRKKINYKEKYIELLEENKNLSTYNLELQKKAFYLESQNIKKLSSKPSKPVIYPKLKKTK